MNQKTCLGIVINFYSFGATLKTATLSWECRYLVLMKPASKFSRNTLEITFHFH
jgi:hypothetical protein